MLLRIGEPLARVVGEDAPFEVSLAVFPEDGLTTGALFGALSAERRTSGPDAKRRSVPTA
jgi:hypothetical protein